MPSFYNAVNVATGRYHDTLIPDTYPNIPSNDVKMGYNNDCNFEAVFKIFVFFLNVTKAECVSTNVHKYVGRSVSLLKHISCIFFVD
jgi:hypothetical protein